MPARRQGARAAAARGRARAARRRSKRSSMRPRGCAWRATAGLMRLPELRQLSASVDPSAGRRLQALKPALEDIKALAGSTPGSARRHRDASRRRFCAAVSHRAGARRICVPRTRCSSAPPSSPTARRASGARRCSPSDIARAWDASSAAAGALMLTARARGEIQIVLQPPSLHGDHPPPDAARPRPRPARLPRRDRRAGCRQPRQRADSRVVVVPTRGAAGQLRDARIGRADAAGRAACRWC